MRYKNIAGRFFGLVTKHACERQTDRETDGWTDRIATPKTALALLRHVVKTVQTPHKYSTIPVFANLKSNKN